MTEHRWLLVSLIAGFLIGTAINEAHAGETGFLVDEETSGMYRICWYDTISGIRPLTIPVTRVCPISVEFEDWSYE